MPIALDNDVGNRVLAYGDDAGTPRKVLVDSSGRIIAVINNTSGPFTVTATNLDIRDLVKAQDELYAVLRTDAGAAYDARTRSWTITEDVLVHTAGLTGRVAVSEPRERSTAKSVVSYSAEGVAPHGNTTRWTYTCPASKIARIEHIFANIFRATAAAPVGRARVLVRANTIGGGSANLLNARIATNNVGDQSALVWAGDLLLEAGDTIDCVTQDLSTGGTIDYEVNAVATEYDV